MEDIKESVKEVDFGEIIKKIKKHKRYYLYTLPIALVLSSLFIICIPRYYKCDVMLAPESQSPSLGGLGSVSSLASAFGMNLSSKIMSSSDAISPELYPDLLESTDFVVSLFTVNVKSIDGKIDTNYYTYLHDKQKFAWWDLIIGKIKNLFKDKEAPFDAKKGANPFRLTKEQKAITKKINSIIDCDVDKKTDVITITVEDQDPQICATMADTVKVKLQKFITDYRTNKARNDLEYTQKLYDDIKSKYEKGRRQYGVFSDANYDVNLPSYKAKLEDLENDLQLQFNSLSAVSLQLQAAKAKVQEQTPVFTTIQSASIPVKPDGPKRMIFVIVVVFITFICTTLYVYRKDS